MPATALATLLALARADAVPPDALDARQQWRVGSIEVVGNDALAAGRIRDAMLTKARPWYRFWEFWKERPPLDPVTLAADVERVEQRYQNEGYYHARVRADVRLPEDEDDEAVAVEVAVDEGPPVYVDTVDVDLRGTPLEPERRRVLLQSLPIARDDVFTQEAYARAETVLRTYYREQGFARVDVTRHATVDVRRDAAAVRYELQSGPPSVFGEVTIEGTEKVSPAVVRREVAFEPGDEFRQSLVERTRANLIGLRLFRSIRIAEDESDDPHVGTRIEVTEGPQHEVRLGIGYDTDEQIRGLAGWRDYNFLGGARQLGVLTRASLVERAVTADFLQPHFPRHPDRTRVAASFAQEDEDAYTNDRARLTPRLEFVPRPGLTPYISYRIEHDSLSDVDDGLRARFPGIAPSNAILSGLALGVDWTTVDDLLDPYRGWAANAVVEPVGTVLGGDVSILRLLGQIRRYQPLPADFLLSTRLLLGFADPIGDGEEVPLYERFYAGGINSVRGYGRRRVGPLFDDDPIGGRSVVEGSVELGHPITDKLGAAVFLDAGQVSLDSWDVPIDDLRYGTGFGIRFATPVGPLRLDLGFPLDPPADDPSWQVHFSIGQAF